MIVRISICLVFTFLFFPAASVSGDTIDLVYEFDGDSDGMTSFGTIEFFQDGLGVDLEIIANTANLVGGDIHEFYFNLPDSIDINTISISNSGGVSDQTINAFTSLGEDPNITGGAGSSFDMGISFGNGGGPPGNGVLTTATFSLTATGGLLVSDFFSETSTSSNVPPMFAAVHFQSADVFGNGSETVGGGALQGPAVPEPASMTLLGFAGLLLLQIRSRKPNFC
jgi:hypothetical protein